MTSKEAEENLRLLVEEMKHTINSAHSETKTTENNCNTKIDQLTKQHLVLMKEKNKMLFLLLFHLLSCFCIFFL